MSLGDDASKDEPAFEVISTVLRCGAEINELI
jgi:hypothetical protein